MKIPLNLNGDQAYSSREEKARRLERDILAARGGDWEAQAKMAQMFQPLLTALARKRSDDIPTINRYIEAGRKGLNSAIKKYTAAVGPEHFQLYALDFIETYMDSVGKHGGFFTRLFGK